MQCAAPTAHPAGPDFGYSFCKELRVIRKEATPLRLRECPILGVPLLGVETPKASTSSKSGTSP